LKEKGKYDEALNEIKNVWDTTLRLEYDKVTGYSEKQWDEFTANRSVEEWEMAAELIGIEAELLLHLKRPDGICFKLQKSLDLYRKADITSRAFSLERMQKIAELEDMLAGINQ
jgi:hypothetical protein